MPDVKQIRAAVEKNRGGWATATEEEVLRLWASLDAATRAAYLKSIEPAAEPEKHEDTQV